ncbi:sensor histidine kinase [Paraflavitalea sp. CAU 1676]|uniref:sensor histidine kinase n=1 Tax=Paraflavitalea sp. CAU 1676 TaxID=3032598 RepID=UPI0023D9CA96|nr:sensor histidine kinase [Paraflavitalea sp. CAU 1676]MDF2192466.1 sensor histidine kinase [Paraflavitalea sp. CAU 1676]
MLISDKKVRPYGYLAFGLLFYCFFMLDMFFAAPVKNLLIKTIIVTCFFTILVWEPVRLIALWAHRRWGSASEAVKKRTIVAAILVPYGFILGFLRIYIEGSLRIWGVQVMNIPVYLLFTGISMLFILLAIVCYEVIFYIQRWQTTQLEANELKKLNLHMQFDSLKVQIQPHFLFNTLNTLIGLIERDQQRAIHFTEDLAYVYRYLLEANQSNIISLEEELKFVKIYFSLLKTRYPEGLFLEDRIEDAALFDVPPLSLQLLIENAVKHNTITRAHPLYINLWLDKGQERVTVRNNYQPKYQVARSGRGLEHMTKKFELLALPPIQIENDQHYFTVSFPVIKAST